jgi:threonine/homoserine/homoserine lactone efflux protein
MSSVNFASLGSVVAAIAELTPTTAAMSAQTISAQMKRGISPGFGVWIGFIVMFLSGMWCGSS